MPLSEGNSCEANKITDVECIEVTKKKAMMSQSEGNISGGGGGQENHGAIPKVNKVVSLNSNINNDKLSDYSKNEIVGTMEGLKLSPDSSDDNLCKNDWTLKAKDSLENLIYLKQETTNIPTNSKSVSCTWKDKLTINFPHSESLIGNNTTPSAASTKNSVSKVLAWDPWDKLKHKKENKRRKNEKKSSSPPPPTQQPETTKSFDHKAGDDPMTVQGYYQPYHQPKNSRSVEFTNKVMVVYIKEDKVIGEAMEPLKKELEQQIRNKEMRKGHMADVPFSKKK